MAKTSDASAHCQCQSKGPPPRPSDILVGCNWVQGSGGRAFLPGALSLLTPPPKREPCRTRAQALSELPLEGHAPNKCNRGAAATTPGRVPQPAAHLGGRCTRCLLCLYCSAWPPRSPRVASCVLNPSGWPTSAVAVTDGWCRARPRSLRTSTVFFLAFLYATSSSPPATRWVVSRLSPSPPHQGVP